MNAVLQEYPLVINGQVLWGEMDAFGHVNNIVYFRYFESVRIAFCERNGMLDYLDKTNKGPILASTSCDFRAPLTYPDNILIGAKVDQIWPKRFSMQHAVYSESQDKIVAEGTAMVVYVDYNKGKSCEIPAQFVDSLNSFT